MDDDGFVQFLPSGIRYKVLGSVGAKEHPHFGAEHGIEVDIYYQIDEEESAYFLRVRYDDQAGELPSWEKYYQIGNRGLVLVDDMHGRGA